MPITRFLLLTVSCLAAILSPSVTAPPVSPPAPVQDDFDKTVQPYFAEHCNRCHDAKKQKGDFRLDTLSRDFTAGTSTMKWMEIIERINTGEMPPKGERQPKPDDTARIVEAITAKLREGEATRLAKREKVAFHRLTREEYANTVRDLLGVTFDATDPNGLPDDPEWHGFERIGSVLSLSPSHIEKYLNAAETVLAEAFPDKAPEKFTRKKDAIDLRTGDRASLTAAGLADKVRVDLWPGADIQGRVGPGIALPAAGYYKIRVKLSGLKPPGGHAPHLAFYAVNLDRMLHEQDVIAAEDKPITIEFTTHLPAGNHNYRMSNDVPGPSNLPRSGRADPRRPFFSIKDGRRPWQIKLTDEAGEPLMPFLIVDSVEWEGPIIEPGPTFAQKNYMPKEKGNAAQLREMLTRFATLAFRRPATAAEVEKFAKLVESEVASGEKFEAAVKTGLVAILCSKDHLYLVEGAADRTKLNTWELASRLSYFLWSTMPDEELLRVAKDGTLLRPEMLKTQVARMLRDPKSARFAEAFPRQWLQLRMVGMFPPDKKLYPDYDEYLQKSMIGETTAFFREVLDKNLSLREFLDSDWTMLNARLADHYGIAGVTDDRFQRVSLKQGDHRGGLLTQAAILSLTSDGTRHRPVHRGKWVMESILGKSPPPPPANVKPIEPTPPTQPKATIRMKLDAHRNDPNCAACHKKIDPLGLAFDNYDAIGRWRTEEISNDGSGDNPKVDASGELTDGRKFTDPPAFKKLLVADMDKFNAAFVEKLAMFAIRRTTTLADHAELAKIAAKGKAADYKLAATVEALVLSDLFQHR
ncbi:MAG: DUF1592 domain-containing protein [Planctomycetes bacterium]|nr:DUF1592 domain-containing protein [Planctomycetota bacterium]